MILVYLCCAWLIGIYAGWQWPVPAIYLWPALCALAVGALLWRKQPAGRLAVACGLAAVFGFLRVSVALPVVDPGKTSLTYYHGKAVSLTGTVIDAPDTNETWVKLNVAVDSLRQGETGSSLPVTGQVLVSTGLYPQFQYGDRLEAAGYLQSPSAAQGASYGERLIRQGFSSVMSYPKLRLLEHGRGNVFQSALLSLREQARQTISRILPDPEGALLSGILLGIPHAVPQQLMASFNATGTSHIIVISGFNIAVVAMALAAVANRWLSRYQAVVVALFGVAFYTLLVGANTSVVRAAVMGSLALVAVLVGRQNAGLTALAAAVLFMTLRRPEDLWDIGFQLSAAATLGLVLFAGPLYQQARNRLKTPGLAQATLPLVNDTLVSTLAAQVFTLPLILCYFQRLSLVMPVANLLVLPAQPIVMGTGALATIAGLIWLPAGQVFGWVAWLFLTYTIRVVEALASVSMASVDIGRLPSVLIWAYCGLILGAVWLNGQSAQDRRDLPRMIASRVPTKLFLSVSILAVVLTWAVVHSLPDKLLHVRFLNVGQGDAILITTPGGQQVLVDGGPNPAAVLPELGQAIPFWDHQIEMVILTHPDQDHLAGLTSVLERYQVDQVIQTGPASRSALGARWEELLREKNVAVQNVSAGTKIDLGYGALVDVLSPPPGQIDTTKGDDNNASVVLRLVYGRASFLLTGDLGDKGEQALLQSGQPLTSTVLKVSHHGAEQATTSTFLAAVAPQMAIISVGENRFGHPSPGTLARLGSIPTLRTDLLGTIDLRSDGISCWTDKIIDKKY